MYLDDKRLIIVKQDELCITTYNHNDKNLFCVLNTIDQT